MEEFNDVNDSPDGALWNSLSAIKQAHLQFHLLTDMCPAPTILASQIEICEVLLVAIAGIRSSLAEDLKRTRGPPQVNGHTGLNS